MSNKQKLQAKKISKMIQADDGISTSDLVLAGIGVLSKAAHKDKRKKFQHATKAGRRAVELDISALDRLIDSRVEVGSAAGEPMICYRSHGGGWYDIAVADTVVERVHGEADSATRVGELLEAFAGAESGDGQQTGAAHAGGGWYDIVVNGVPVEKVRGREPAEDRMAAIEKLNV